MSRVSLFVVLTWFFGAGSTGVDTDDLYKLRILHFNDFHARYEKVDPQTSGSCMSQPEEECYGGYARLNGFLTSEKANDPNIIVLNAGDVFTGTLWFNLFKWNVTAEFMNMLPVDAMTLGNHEFDSGGVHAATEYLKLIKNTPTLIANVDASKEPDIAPYISKSIIIERKGCKIGIVGYVTTDYVNIATVGQLIFLDEVQAVREEIASLRKKGAQAIIVLSHAGFIKDLEVAKSIGADIIVGGHSHTFLYTGTPPTKFDHPASEYPTVVTQKEGRKVLVVQAAAFSRYVGQITLGFSREGNELKLQSWSGNPILLDKQVKSEKKIEATLEPWRQEVHLIGSKKVGETLVFLQQSGGVCYVGECNIGRLITDAMVHEYVKQKEGRSWTKAAVALVQTGGIRSSIHQGNITYADVWDTLPFEDYIGLIELNGQHLLELLEFSVSRFHAPFLQASGIKAKFDLTKPSGQRVSDVYIRCAKCEVPKYEPIRLYKSYPIVINEYMYEGGDSFYLIKKNARFWTKGRLDTQVVFDYLKERSPVHTELDGNIVVHGSPEMKRKIISVKNKLYHLT